jgi:hypothetical protein
LSKRQGPACESDNLIRANIKLKIKMLYQTIPHSEPVNHLLAIEIEFRGVHSEHGHAAALRCPRLQARRNRKFIPIDMGSDESWLQQAVRWLNRQGVCVAAFACLGADKYVALCNFCESTSIQNALA